MANDGNPPNTKDPRARKRVGVLLAVSLLTAALASDWHFARLLARVVNAALPLYKNPVDLTWAGFAVFSIHSIAALLAGVTGFRAHREAQRVRPWRAVALVAAVLGGLVAVVFVLGWWGTAFVEAFPWQRPLP